MTSSDRVHGGVIALRAIPERGATAHRHELSAPSDGSPMQRSSRRRAVEYE